MEFEVDNKEMYYGDDMNMVFKEHQENNFVFHIKDQKVPVLELRENGDILVKGKLVENDKEVVDGLKDFLAGVRRG